MLQRDIDIDVFVDGVGRLRTPKGGLILLSRADPVAGVLNMEVPVFRDAEHVLSIIVREDASKEEITERIIAAAEEYLAVQQEQLEQ